MKLTDAKGTIMASYAYSVYGELLSGDTGLTRFLYNGRCGVSTDDNGLYYMRQRYYNPEIKRFVNQDVLTGSIGNSQSLNRYSYVQGNPVSYTDPFGLSPLAGLFEGTGFVHGVLGILGCIPGIGGAVFNAIDAWVYYYYDKDYFMATMCGISALSMGFGSVAKFAAGGSRVGNYLATGCTFLSNGLEFAQNGMQAAVVGYSMWDKYVVNGAEMGWDTVGEAAGLTLSVMACAISGVNMSQSGKQFGKMLKEDGISCVSKKNAVQFSGVGNSQKTSTEPLVPYNLQFFGGHSVRAEEINWKGFSGKKNPNTGLNKLQEHYNKHVIVQGEFGDISQNEYLKRAKAFAKETNQSFYQQQVANTLIKYDPETRRMFIGHIKDREIRTFYIADDRVPDPFWAAIEEAMQKNNLL